MDVDWVFLHLLFYVAVWTLMLGTSFATREWLKKHYPCFAELWHHNDPKPNPLPTCKKKFLISIYSSLCALGGALFLSLLLSGPTEDGPPSRPWIDKFVLVSCFMLYTVWDEIGTYFRLLNRLIKLGTRVAYHAHRPPFSFMASGSWAAVIISATRLDIQPIAVGIWATYKGPSWRSAAQLSLAYSAGQRFRRMSSSSTTGTTV